MSELFFVSRPMCHTDIKQVVEIDKLVFGVESVPKRVFKALLEDPEVFGHVVRDADSERILGYVLIRIHRREIEIIRMATHPEHQQQGIGTQMVQFLIIERHKNIRAIVVMVRERNLQAQMFFKHLGFVCESQIPDFYPETEEAGYLFALGD